MAATRTKRADSFSFPEIKKQLGFHVLVLFLVLLAFFATGLFLSNNYLSKTKQLALLGDVRVLRTDTVMERLRYLYSRNSSYTDQMCENYSLMFDFLVDSSKVNSAFSEDITKINILTSNERRLLNTLVALMHYRGFSSADGEYQNFFTIDDELRLAIKKMLEGEPPTAVKNAEVTYDYFEELANCNLSFVLYNRTVLDVTEAASSVAFQQAIVEKLQDIKEHLQAHQADAALRDEALGYLLNKTQTFKRIVKYDMQIRQHLQLLDDTDIVASDLLENVYFAVQNKMRLERLVAFLFLGLFLFFIIGTVVTFSRFVHRSANYSLRRDVRLAELASEAKSAFLSNISHEIRSPLNAVLGLDELIIRESSEDRIVDYALNIQRSGKTLLNLINDVLDFSKIEAGKVALIPAEYDITSVVGDLYSMISPRAAEKKLTFNVTVAEDLPHLLIGDEMRIKQCVLNILTNGVKYTNKGHVALEISWEKVESVADMIRLIVRVSDTGIGIKESDMPKLFRAFERIEERRNRTIEGTGLGMAIVNNLLSLMGSHLDVQSEYGRGSVFSFAIEQQVADWTPVGSDIAETYHRRLQRTKTPFHHFTAPDARILVVDDTAINLTVVRGLLKPTQITVDTALSGHEALKLVTQKHYDLIFLDHRMPVMDGIETLRFMQTLDANLNKEVPIIVLTANVVSGAREKYIAEGFSDYMAKPIDMNHMEKVLREYLPQNLVQVGEFTSESEEQEDDSAAIESALALAAGIDLDSALINCGGADVLQAVLLEYYNTIEERASAIEAVFAARDWKNYTVLVHALKSASRLVGALSLSTAAADLEAAGDRAQVPAECSAAARTMALAAVAEITDATPQLLSDYRAYREKLASFAEAVQKRDDAESGSKPLIDNSAYCDALSSLAECMQVSDFDLADQIISMLDGYRMESPLLEHYKAVKAAVAAVDPARVLSAIAVTI